MPIEDQRIEVVIEYDEFIAGRELSEIIEILDEALWYEIEDEMMFPPFRYRHPFFRRFQESPPSLFCITEVNKGSLFLTGFIGGAAVKYCFDRFKKGLNAYGLDLVKGEHEMQVLVIRDQPASAAVN